MRVVAGIFVGLVVAALVAAFLLFLSFAIGGTECARADCNAFGDFIADGTGRTLAEIVIVAGGVLAGAVAGWLIVRR